MVTVEGVRGGSIVAGDVVSGDCGVTGVCAVDGFCGVNGVDTVAGGSVVAGESCAIIDVLGSGIEGKGLGLST